MRQDTAEASETWHTEKESCFAGDGSALGWRDDGSWAGGCHRESYGVAVK